MPINTDTFCGEREKKCVSDWKKNQANNADGLHWIMHRFSIHFKTFGLFWIFETKKNRKSFLFWIYQRWPQRAMDADKVEIHPISIFWLHFYSSI